MLNSDIILLAIILMIIIVFVLRKELEVLDVITLGKEQAVNLGVDYDHATALVGPISFFGLIVANFSRQMFKTYRHKELISGSALFGIILLTAGQMIVEQVYSYAIPISVFITVGGGLYFLYLLLAQRRRT